ncbi:ABC transporter substrate-binding protein [Microbacterium dauci]|uniref:Extracellular solute-binding protein n=1 Tax=Microbacterium dauci TaxID=3048008 RepID=A0ABT6ZE82_9MICO|nr:extracellular solute-binding protein [Microbacterium sp. LX3-4]MDJ1114472.1 extracellular solute-binding protein [Microbacterium sp. LX3-4]
MSNDARPRIRRFTAVAVGITAMALTGCGFVNAPPSDQEEASGTVTAYVNTEMTTGLGVVSEAFTEESGLELDMNSAETADLNTQLRVQLTSDTAADLLRVSPGMSSPVAAGVLATAGELADLSDEPWAADVDPAMAALATVDGRLHAFPVARNSIAMVYNKAVFEEAGIDAPPETWSELLDAAEKIAAVGKTPIAAGLAEGIHLQFYIYALAASIGFADGTDLNDRQLAGETSFADDPAWAEVFEKFEALFPYFTPDSTGVPPDQAMQELARGDAGMHLNVTAALPAIADYSEEGADAFGVFVMPGTDDAGDTRLPMAPEFIAINANAKNLEGAKSFLEFFGTQEQVQAYADAAGSIPGLSVGASPSNEALTPILPFVDEGRTAPFANYLWPNGDTQQTLLQQGVLWVNGDITADEVAQQMDAKFEMGAPE